MLTVSVTELIDFMDCRRKWTLRHQSRLQPKHRPPNLASGTVVHATIGEALGQTGRGQWLDDIAEERLMAEFEHHDNQIEQVKKYLPGVKRALAQCPAWLWEEKGWGIEERLTLVVPLVDNLVASNLIDGGPPEILGPLAVELVGRPDLYRVHSIDGGESIELVEIKTTDNDPLDYLLWNPQHRYYAAMLQILHPTALITFRYLCLPTQGKYKEHSPWVFTERAFHNTMDDLHYRCRDWATALGWIAAYNQPNEGSRCKWCDFAPICTAHIAGIGGGAGGVIDEQFTVRPPRAGGG